MSAKRSGQTRKEQKAATRIDLLAAARHTFISTGVAKTGVGDVAKAAGVAHGTFYVHFENKDAVVRALLAEFNATFARRVADAVKMPTSRSVPRMVRQVATTFLDYWEQERDFIACVADQILAGISLVELGDGVNPPMVMLLERALYELAGDTPVDAARIELLCHALLAMWLRLGLRYLFAKDATRKHSESMLVELTTAAIGTVMLNK